MSEAMRALGARIYEESLGDRRGFRSDQTGVPDELWPEIFEGIGRAAMRHCGPVPEGWRAFVDRVVPPIDPDNPEPLDPEDHCCEYVLWVDRERIRRELLDVAPTPEDSHG